MRKIPATVIIPASMALTPKTHFHDVSLAMEPLTMLPNTPPRGAPAAASLD